MGSGALFLDAEGRVLLLRPTYKPYWEIPGGAIEVGESPRQACSRELREELGLNPELGRLLVFDWIPAEPPRPDGWMFVFDGGHLSEDVAAQIRLPADELSEWRFVAVDELESFLLDRMVRRIRHAHRCVIEKVFADLEWGFVPSVESGAS
jgi:8-oxo-dGTP diphosphatase